MALMGRDLLAKIQTVINLPFLDPISILCIQMAPKPLASPHSQNLPPDLPLIDPQVWDTEALSVARHHSPIQVDSELQVIGTVAGHKVSFLIDTGAAFLLLTSFQGPLQPSEVAVKGVSGIPF